MKKKLISLLLAICTLSTFVACGEEPAPLVTEDYIENEIINDILNEENSENEEISENLENNTSKFTESNFTFEKYGIIYDFESVPKEFWTAQNKENNELTNTEYIYEQLSAYSKVGNTGYINNYKLKFFTEPYQIIMNPSSSNGLETAKVFKFNPSNYLFNFETTDMTEYAQVLAFFINTDLEVCPIEYTYGKHIANSKDESIGHFEFYKEINGWESYITTFEMPGQEPVISQVKLYKEFNNENKRAVLLTCEEMPSMYTDEFDIFINDITNYFQIEDTDEIEINGMGSTKLEYKGNQIIKLNDKYSLNLSKMNFYELAPASYARFEYGYTLNNKNCIGNFYISEFDMILDEYLKISNKIVKEEIPEYKDLNMYSIYIDNEDFVGVIFEADGHTFIISQLYSTTIKKDKFIEILSDIIINN